ncbi:MAG TPA: diguanylate cyclase [Rhodocyclaceae bacterium]|nr:diguanylate cyclase [Rhodocyclaceae bacterium]
MIASRIRYKLLTSLALALTLGFSSIAYFYTDAVERLILVEYQRTLHRVTDSVVMNVQTLMSENHANILPEYSRRLRKVPGLLDFRMVRVDGYEAFVDNKTISEVNIRTGDFAFQLRSNPAEPEKVFSPEQPEVAKALLGMEAIISERTMLNGLPVLYFYDPIPNTVECHRCHGGDDVVRGVLRITASLDEIEREMLKVRLRSLGVLALALIVTLLITERMLSKFIAKPIEKVTQAMTKISSGEFESKLDIRRTDELGEMANSFNAMTSKLRASYLDMLNEQQTLNTVIQGAREAVVLTDANGKVVFVNAIAIELLGKSAEKIGQEGFLHLLEQPERFLAMLQLRDEEREPVLFEYNGHWLFTSVTTIRDDEDLPIGSSALMRDVTQEQRLLNELKRLSTTDALTDVYNRRHLDACLKQEMERARQTGQPISVIMLDVDHFKKFNDTYGHDQGDRVLKATGQVMKLAVRKYDIPCRYGGEEFTVILPATDVEGTLAVAERLRKDVEAMEVDGLKVTVSLGVASFPEIAVDTPEALVMAADAALYRSKEAGRNRSTAATVAMLASE